METSTETTDLFDPPTGLVYDRTGVPICSFCERPLPGGRWVGGNVGGNGNGWHDIAACSVDCAHGHLEDILSGLYGPL